MKFWRTIALAAVLAMAGCATRKNGTTQLVRVTSTPPGAEVFLDGRSRGTTPTWIRLSRRSREPRIRIEREGHSHHMWLRRGMSPWMLANIPAGVGTGVVGMMALRGCDECGSGRKRDGGQRRPRRLQAGGGGPGPVPGRAGQAQTVRPVHAPRRVDRGAEPRHHLPGLGRLGLLPPMRRGGVPRHAGAPNDAVVADPATRDAARLLRVQAVTP